MRSWPHIWHISGVYETWRTNSPHIAYIYTMECLYAACIQLAIAGMQPICSLSVAHVQHISGPFVAPYIAYTWHICSAISGLQVARIQLIICSIYIACIQQACSPYVAQPWLMYSTYLAHLWPHIQHISGLYVAPDLAYRWPAYSLYIQYRRVIRSQYTACIQQACRPCVAYLWLMRSTYLAHLWPHLYHISGVYVAPLYIYIYICMYVCIYRYIDISQPELRLPISSLYMAHIQHVHSVYTAYIGPI